MPLPCPACGFLSIEEDCYGTYNIFPICGWENDAAQLGNPACDGGANGESLVEAQLAALAKHPLTIAITDNMERDSQWRPLNAAERETAEAEKQTEYWINNAVYDPETVYWKKDAIGATQR